MASNKFLLSATSHGIYYSDSKGVAWQKSYGSTDLFISSMNFNPLTGMVLATADSIVEYIVWNVSDWKIQYKSVGSRLIASFNGGRDWFRSDVGSPPSFSVVDLCWGSDKLLSLQYNQSHYPWYDIYKALPDNSWGRFIIYGRNSR